MVCNFNSSIGMYALYSLLTVNQVSDFTCLHSKCLYTFHHSVEVYNQVFINLDCSIASHFMISVIRFMEVLSCLVELTNFSTVPIIHANSTDLGVDLPILSRLKRLTTLHTTSTTFLQF